VAADGTWSVAVPLNPGANTLTATATDADGNTANAQRTVTLAMLATAPSHPTAPPARLVPSNAFSLSVAQPKDRKSVRLTLRLPGAGAIRATLKRTTHASTLATAKNTAKKAGKATLTLRLGRSALKLLRRSHTLRAQLSVSFTPAGGTTRTIKKRLTLRAP
jgi:hypothetical protein